jgi:hypothetical protein
MYQQIEQLFCKIDASNDMLSQAACWFQFEQRFPPNSQAFDNLLSILGVAGVILLLGILKVRSGGFFGWRKI